MTDTLDRQGMARILNASLQAGRILLEHGANTALVEDTVQRLGVGLGADSMDVYVTPGGILATLVCGHEHRTRVQRVNTSGVQLTRLAQVLELVERVQTGSAAVGDVETRLAAIQELPHQYPPAVTAVAVGLACAAFAVSFGGTLRDAGVVALTSTLAQLLRHLLSRTRLGRLLTSAVVAAFASALALALCGDLSGVAAAAAILLLVPGVPLVSSTIDLFRGDLIAGAARATHALLSIIVGGAGVWVVVQAWGRHGATPVLPGQPDVGLAALMGGVAAAGFGVLFDVPHRCLATGALVGCLAVLTRSAALAAGWPPEGANLAAGLTVGLAAEALSRWQGVPYSLLAMPGYIPLVPGVLFFTGILHLADEQYLEGLSALVRAQLILVAIALGMGSVPAVLDTHRKGMT